jgi:hypothetical protein
LRTNFSDPINSDLGIIRFGANTSGKFLYQNGAGFQLHGCPLYVKDVAGAYSDVYARKYYGTAQYAEYADVAEVYATDVEYPVGTVVMVGGEKEATIITDNTCYVLGVISENPAVVMNSKAEGQAIALLGRVPVFIQGSVKKGEPIWPAATGCGCNIDNGKRPFAFALENGADGLVECVIR